MMYKRLYFLILLLPGMFSCRQKPSAPPLFEQLPSAQTNIHFVNRVSDNELPGILDYLYYYNGGGVAVGDINNDGLPDIFFTANQKGGNKLYLNKGNFKFEDITQKAGIAPLADWSTGVTMADVNNDGYLDIYVCAVAGKLNLKGHNLLYINNHNGTFTERSAEYGLDFSGFSTQAVFFDYNHDGKLDCFLLNQSDHSVSVYRDTALRHQQNKLAGSRLYLNTGGHFTDVTLKSGIYSSALGYGLGVAVGDVNNDGWEDIYVGNDFHENDYYYINNHNGTFTEAGAKHFNHYSRFSMGNDMADFNNDGQLDIITADMLPGEENVLKSYGADESYDQYKFKISGNGFQDQYSRNALQKNMGNGEAFSDVALMDGVYATDWSWSPLLADFDNDGIKDLFIANGIKRRALDMDYVSYISNDQVQGMLRNGHGYDSVALDKMPSGAVHSYLFKGNANERFTDKSTDWGMREPGLANGGAYADLDNDGRLDLVTNNVNHEAGIFKNNAPKTNYLALRFTGHQDNVFGIGVKVYVFCGGQMQYEQLMLTRGFQSSTAPELHFGLGKSTRADSLIIVWPNQNWQMLKNVKTGQKLTINQKNAAGIFNYQQHFPAKKALFREITSGIHINWQHHENDFVDFNQQPLIPHMLSTEGPRMAVADVNHDGLDDFYICGARNQPGALFIQTATGDFKPSPQPALVTDSASEDIDAAFLDANHDGFPDLYVASGGSELPANSPELADRLYMNDGKGNFIKSANIPVIKTNKSAIAVADINRDGYPDIFIGGAPDGLGFGKTPQSYLLVNNGHGVYKQVNIPNELQNAGMLRSAAFADLNNDGWPDLVVAGEWMPVKTFINQKGKLVQQHQPIVDQLSGWWQKVVLADVDGDGKIDILAGNYGCNSKLKPSTTDPLKLYTTDIDKNGTIDPIMAYGVNQNYYTFLSKGDIERQVPVIKKKFLYFKDFAGKTVEQVFGDSLISSAHLTAATFQSGVFYNKGQGKFEFKAFPLSAQVAPLFGLSTFSAGQRTGVMAGGNFSGVLPYEGRYDADYGDVLLPDSHHNLQNVSSLMLRGEVRDIKPIKTAKGIIYVVAFNNKAIRFFKVNE